MRVCFNSITDPAAEFHLFNPKNKDIYHLFKENIVGGPSIIFNRYHETGKTFIPNNPNKPCQKIIGYDANALYLTLYVNFHSFQEDAMTGSTC